MRKATAIAANNEPFWVADGLSRSAQLEYGGVAMVDASDVYISGVFSVDWQGTHRQQPYLRTNSIKNSGTLVGGSGSNVTLGTGTGTLPDGTTGTFATITTTATASPQVSLALVNNNIYPDPSGGYTFRCRVQDINSQFVCLQVNQYNASGTTLLASAINFDMTNGIFGAEYAVAVGKNNFINITALLVNGWWQLSFTFAPIAGATRIQPYIGQCSALTGRGGTIGAALRATFVQNCSGTYLPTTTAIATQTDLLPNNNDIINFGYLPKVGTQFLWTGTATSEVLDYTPTLLAQYANSPIICQLIDDFNQCIDPSVDIDAFYANIWDISQCQGIGLDIWGRIVNIPRTITLSALQNYLGYQEALPTSFTFNAQPMYTGPVQGTQYTLSDDAYRVLIMTKALANISSFTAPSINKLLQFMFAGRGSCYVLELSPMQIEYVFNFALTSWEASVLQQPALMPRPAGVGVSIIVNS